MDQYDSMVHCYTSLSVYALETYFNAVLIPPPNVVIIAICSHVASLFHGLAPNCVV